MVDPARLVSSGRYAGADAEEISLRPRTLDDYVGQEKAKEQPEQSICEAAQHARRADGPRPALRPSRPGQDHPCQASWRNEMGVQIRVTSGPAIEKPGDLAALLTNLQRGRHPLYR